MHYPAILRTSDIDKAIAGTFLVIRNTSAPLWSYERYLFSERSAHLLQRPPYLEAKVEAMSTEKQYLQTEKHLYRIKLPQDF